MPVSPSMRTGGSRPAPRDAENAAHLVPQRDNRRAVAYQLAHRRHGHGARAPCVISIILRSGTVGRPRDSRSAGCRAPLPEARR